MHSPGQPIGFYEPPKADGGRRPGVILWFRIYAAMMVLGYLGVAGFFFLWQFFAPSTANEPPPSFYGLLALFVVIFGGFYVLAALVPYKPWGWTVGLIAICLGLTSGLLFFVVPLLIFWLRQDTKVAFGRL